MTDMLEKIARAMYEAEPGYSPSSGPQWDWDWMVAEGWILPGAFRRRARAALLAMREPTDGVLWSAPALLDNAHLFTAMIDAILKEVGE